MAIHSLRSRLSTMSCPLFIRFIIVCSINMNVHLQHSYMGIRGILSRSYKHQIILDDLCIKMTPIKHALSHFYTFYY